MDSSADLGRKIFRFQRLIVGVGSLVLLEKEVERLMMAAYNHPTKSYEIEYTTPCSALVLEQRKKESDQEFNDLRILIRTRIFKHPEYIKRAESLIRAVREHEPEFDWDVIIPTKESPICQRSRRNTIIWTSETDRRFLKSLRIASDPPQTVDRKS